MAIRKWICVLPLFLALTISCQRAQDDNFGLSIQISGDLGGQSASDLQHVVINITGNDMPAIVYTWDRHGENGIEQAIPAEFNFSITPGNRLVQVIAVYKTASGSGMEIYYGDVARNLAAKVENLAIQVANIGQGAPAISGNISGRYLTSANQGPTGKVEMRYQPAGGRPEMLIEKSHIVNGWFNFFALSGVPLRYVLQDGTDLWGGAVSLDSAVFSTSSDKISRVSIPVVQRKEYQGGNFNWMAEDAQIYVYGWFGPAVSSEIICQPSILGSFTRIVNYNTSGLINNSDPSPGYFLSLTMASSPPTAAELTNTASASNFAVAAYGVTSSATCSGYAELTNKITLSQSQFDGQGRDGAAAFSPPFMKTGSQSSVFSFQASAGMFSISTSLLPDLYPNLIDGLHIYKRVVNDGWEARDSMFSCSTAAIGQAQFALVTQVSSGTLASGILPYTPVIASGEQSYTGSAVLVCPSKNGNLLEWGHVIKGNNFQ